MSDKNNVKVSGGVTSRAGLEQGMKKKAAIIGVGSLVVIMTMVMWSLPEAPKEKEKALAQVVLDDSKIDETVWQTRAQAKLNEAEANSKAATRKAAALEARLERQLEENSEMSTQLKRIERVLDIQGRRLTEEEQRRLDIEIAADEAKREERDAARKADRERAISGGSERPARPERAARPPAVKRPSRDSELDADRTNRTDADGKVLPPPPPRPPIEANRRDVRPPPKDAYSGRSGFDSEGVYGSSSERYVPDSGHVERKPIIFAPPMPEGYADKDEDALGSYSKNPFAGYMPAGSFAEAVLLTGLDAGASKQTQSNPQPVLLRIQNEAVTPGGGEYNISQCFAIGSGYGDISAERAYIRLARLSCLDPERGLVLEASINGFLADSDGFQGLRGKVVRRNGQLLAKSLLAGFAEGVAKVGEAASQAASRSITSPTSGGGTTSQEVDINAGDLAKAGAFGGASSAASQVASFYLKEAQSIFPVVSIPPGRKVTVVITEGAALTWSSYEGKYVKEFKPRK